jgi:NADPH-dependent glutamate synthase beta subunit-like oxidoreductase/coenzyme F420-reducing hydrogenase delta subunit/NAD-dependent dihydropyrimidine dehydrogenase PreA subunit
MDTQLERQAPCLVACPVHTDTRLYVERILEGRYEDALELLLAANPFTSVCGRICHHPCEQSCRRSKVDAPVGLRQLKRFVVEATADYRLRRRAPADRTRSERIAIIGSGPAGLTAAHDLARAGFGVTVFEAAPEPGGMLGAAIPRYRLPYDVLREDIDDILALGVELKTGCAVGADIEFSELERGFDAILVATGLSESRSLGVPGIDSRGVLLALPLLRATCAGQPPELGERVVVIGGGNVAVDVARCARRLGVADVTLACLESRDEMPAWEWEVAEALEEGIKLAPSWGPSAVETRDGAVSGIHLKRCTRVFDDQGRFSPAFDEAETTLLPAHSIILAIGQRADLACLKGSSVAVGRDQRLEYDPQTMATSARGVFACGEVVTGPGAAVEAVADGHRAARAIQHFLDTGELLTQAPREELPSLGDLPPETIERIKERARVRVALAAADARVRDFSEIERGFTEAEARAEAQRCLACTTGAFVDEDRCAACLTCVRVCPFGVATVARTAVMPDEKCQACGLCAALCPAAAIALKRFGAQHIQQDLSHLLAGLPISQRPRMIVSFCCLFETTSRKFLEDNPQDVAATGVARVLVPCVGRLSVVDMLAPFEMGADGVCVVACASGECLYPTAEERLRARVEEVKRILDQIGLGGERIDLWRTKDSAEVSWSAFWEVSRRKLAAMAAQQAGNKP